MSSLPLTFNALAIKHVGAPVSLQRNTITALQDDEVLIRVSYASINKMDPALAQRNIFNLPEPYVLGFDFSGDIIEIGGKSQEFKVGQKVFGRTLRGGGFAEYLVAKKEHVLPCGGVPAAEASSFGVAFMTAYESLMVAGNLEPYKGKWIYIAGAAGGVGHFAVQLAKIHGLKVIGSAGKPASLQLLRELRLDHIIDYSKQNVVQEVLNLTNGKGAELVYDSTYAQSSYTQSAAVVAKGGEYIRLGTTAQLAMTGAQDMRAIVEGRGAKMIIGDAGRYGVDPQYISQAWKLDEGLRKAVAWYEEGKLKPMITEKVPFEAAALQKAFEGFMKGTTNVGKVVVQCGK